MRLAAFIGLTVLAGILAGCAGDLSQEDDETNENAQAGVGAGTTPVPIDLSFEHPFVAGPETMTFDVSSATPGVRVELWFEGAIAPGEALAIRLLSPQGENVVETNIPGNFAGGAVGGRTNLQTATLTLSEGAWTLEFSGTGTPTGRATLRS